MLPPKFELASGQVVSQNPGQKYLWECWLHMCNRVRKLKPDAIVVNGDVVDGTQHIQRGTELCIPVPSDQLRAAASAIFLLQDAAPQAKCYMVQGTEYHDSKVGQAADALAGGLGFRDYHGKGIGRWSRESLNLEVEGVVLNFHHGVGGTYGLYRTTSIDREAVWSALAGKDGKAIKADCLIRSHLHYFVHIEHPTKHAFITPCWQLQTGFMRRNSEYRMIPDVGFSWITVDGEAKKRGDDPIHVEKCIYPLPAEKPVALG